MAWKIKHFQCLIWGVACCLVCGIYLALLPLSTEPRNCSLFRSAAGRDDFTAVTSDNSSHKLAILVPFRDRFEEMMVFVPYMHKFLLKQGIDYHIYVLNQVDQYRFNRASLVNVGFLLTEKSADYIAMHDIDLLPLNPSLSYAYPKHGPFHVAAPDLHPRYSYPTFVGGILLLKREDFRKVNGMSNKYWGWGLEDDEFYVRLKEAGLVIRRPVNVTTGRKKTFRHIHNHLVRKRDVAKCFDQRESTRRRDRKTGLHDVHYKIADQRNFTIDGAPATVINIQLICNQTISPWCLCSESDIKNAQQKEKIKSKAHEKV